MNEWVLLSKKLPKGKQPVLLFNRKLINDEFVGHPVCVSNTAYARKNAIKYGYTHWCKIPPYPKI